MEESTLEKFAEWTKLKAKIHDSDSIDFYFHEREIWWASLGKNIGYEENGKNEKFERPVLVLKKFNKKVLWALAITSKTKEGKYYYHTDYKSQTHSIILSQLRLISSKRLTRKLRRLPKKEFQEVKEKINSFL